MTTLTSAFASAANSFRDDIALVDGQGASFTFTQIQDRAFACAGAWHAKGVRPGDRVLIAMGIGADLYVSLAALWSLGATVVLPEPAMGLRGLKHAVATTKPAFFCAAGAYCWIKLIVPGLWRARLLTPQVHSTANPPKAVEDAAAIALISFTSGTTGAPKAIPRSHAFLMAQQAAVAPLLASDAKQIDLVTFPVFVLINLAAGRTSVLPNWKMTKLGALNPNALMDWIKVNGCTRALLPPALCEKLVVAKDVGTLRQVFTGGGPVFPDVVDGLRQCAEHLDVTTVYGSTEAEPIAHLHNGSETGDGLLVGHPVPAVRLRIVDTEIQVAGDHVNTGYLDPSRDADTKVKEGDVIWHRTGDAGRLDDQGRLWLLGRVADQVATDQGPLYPFVIETAARAWDGVARAALMQVAATPVLAIEGDVAQLSLWTEQAQDFGVVKVIHIDRMPLDRRHHSKVDRKVLISLLQQKLG